MERTTFNKAVHIIDQMKELQELMDLLGNSVCNNNELAVIKADKYDSDEFCIINRVSINSVMKDSLLAVVKDKYNKLEEEFHKL